MQKTEVRIESIKVRIEVLEECLRGEELSNYDFL